MKPRVLVVSNLFPNSQEPQRGTYLRQLVERLGSSYEIRVVAPVPWMPRSLARVLKARVDLPPREIVSGTQVYHPRYLVIPKILRFIHGFTLAWSLRRALRKVRIEFPYDLISVHWMFPDAFATVLANRNSDIPIVAHAMGCDINDYIRYPLRRKMIRWALLGSSGIVTKSKELANKISSLVGDVRSVNVIYNGVDRQIFRPVEREIARRQLDIPNDASVVLFVGNLAVEKAVSVLLDAFARVNEDMPDTMLVIVGDGPLKKDLLNQVDKLNLTDSVSFLGQRPHDQIPTYLNAADVLCLPSLREGCPNVVLESLSCGTPVVASAVGAIPEMLERADAGFLTKPGDVDDLAANLQEAILRENESIHSFVWPSWEDNAASIGNVLDACIVARQEAP
jgi:glycosyltransferase involved in cell wall biosynthesis